MPEVSASTYVSIDPDRCKGCQLCISVCPRKIIGMGEAAGRNGYVVAVTVDGRGSTCTGCLSCTDMCPDSAITIYRRTEADRAHRVTRPESE